MTGAFLGVLFDGFAYGMLLFLLSIGLSVTLGMMNFVNLAHGSFAMLGGYAAVTLMNGFGWPFLATLPAAFAITAAVSVVVERTLFRRLYRGSELSQCLLTIGVVFISVAGAAYIYGTVQQPVELPSYLRGAVTVMGVSFGVYRLFLIAVGLAITAVLIAALEYTASARRCVRPSTTSAWRAAWASTSTPHSPSRSRSAAVSPASAAHSPFRSSGSIMRLR
jgi:branched-chain amino acid transport system permease protein